MSVGSTGSVSSGVGLISGIDYETMITKLSALSSRQVTVLQQQQSVFGSKNSAYQAVSSKLSALQSQLQSMLSASDYDFQTAKSSNTGALTVSASSSAAVGTYSINVLQLGQAERRASQGVGSETATIASGAGSLTVQVGIDAARSYTLDGNTTLAQLRDQINQDSQSGVTASVLNDGSPTSPYRLILTSKKTGAANDITISRNDTSLDFTNKQIEAAVAGSQNVFDGAVTAGGAYTGTGSQRLALKVVQAGDLSGGDTAAQFVISHDGGITFGSTRYKADSSAPVAIAGADGLTASFSAGTRALATGDTFSIDLFDPSVAQAADAVISVDGMQVSRPNNTFDDVIKGVSLTALGITTSAATVSVANDSGQVNAKATAFQTAFNDVLKMIAQATAYDPKTKVAQALFGDSGVRTIHDSLKMAILNPQANANPAYSTLAALGMSLQADGTLGFNQSTINDALAKSPDAVLQLFARSGQSTNTQVQFVSATDKTANQPFRLAITSAATRAGLSSNQGLDPAGLSADETLTFTANSKTFSVSLAAGSKLDSVVSQLNDKFAGQSVHLTASNRGGVLQIDAKEYGSNDTFKVTSDRPGDTSGQLGIGTTQRTADGTDVAGTINGTPATGNGQTLTGATGTAAEGLALQISATAPTTATVTFSQGLASRLLDQVNSYLDATNGIIGTHEKGYQASIDSLNTSITRMQTRITNEASRMRKQFQALEQQLAQYQSIGNFITQWVNQLSTTSNSRSR